MKDTVTLQTRYKIADTIVTHSVPLQAVGPRPSYLQNVKIGTDEDAQIKQQGQSFLGKYVRISSDYFMFYSVE